MNQALQPKGQVRVYACGGGGLNIGQMLERHRGEMVDGFACCSVAYMDASTSNLSASIDDAHCYLFDGLDGSGQVRAENHIVISRHIAAILEKFPALDLNIILCTAGGGTGSVLAPLLASELLSRGEQVVVIAIGSSDTRTYIQNTLNTIKSMEQMALKNQAPVVTYYLSNSDGREEADAKVREVVMALCVLFSRANRELDGRDLRNWLRFSEKVTTFPPMLAALTIVEGTNDIEQLDLQMGNIMSVATLAKDGGKTTLNPMPEYQCTGFVAESVDKQVQARLPLHFVTSDALFTQIAKDLHEKLAELDSNKLNRRNTKGVLSATDTPVESGLVL